MNIFFVDDCPSKAAQALCDKHVVKMVLESTQLLSSAHYFFESKIDKSILSKLTHKNHPCAKWVRTSIENYRWLAVHALALSKEYTFRYNRLHSYHNRIITLSIFEPNIPDVGFTNPSLSMPQEYKISNNPVECYRDYYNKCKMVTIQCRWTKRKKPDWIIL